jgi:Flp pilus assembly protein TadG
MRRGSETGRRQRLCAQRRAGCRGSVAAEFAVMAPIILLIIAATADFGSLIRQSSALAGATRIGAEYARFRPFDLTGIKDAMQTSMSFNPPLSFPASFPQSCECDDGTATACSQSCATVGRPGPNRVFMRITANQAVAPLVSWPGLPRSLSSTTEIRLQ